jgi:membrane-bound ClpP family serine protease
MTIANQTFDDTVIEGQSGENIVNIENSGSIQIDDENIYDASSSHTMTLANQTVTVTSIAGRK